MIKASTFCKKIVLAAVTLMCSFAIASAQTLTLKGTVTDSNGNPLIGVAVIEDGTTNGAMTEADGTWTLSAGKNAVITFSCLGYAEQKLPAADAKALLKVVLAEENLMIDGTVVIGYGAIRRSTLANSVTSVRSEDFIQGAVASPLQMLQGKVAGLSVSTASGDPNGGGVQMMLRGVSTLMSNQEPLIVIDGIAGGSMNNVTQDDILSVDVLKDGAAAAIYGTQGNNGVILITTKRGMNEKSSIHYHGYASVESISNKIETFTADEYRTLKDLSGGAFKPLDGGASTDWYSQAFRTAVNHYHNVSMNGGGENANYYANITYNSRQGIIKGSGLDKFNVSVGTNQSFFNKKLKISANLSNIYAKGTQVSEEDAYLAALICNPTLPVYKEDGSYQFFADVMNAARCVNEFREDINWNETAATGKITYSPIEGLTLNAVGGMKLFYHFNGSFATSNFDNTGKNGMAWRNTSMRLTYNGELYAAYNKRFGKHDINAVAGYSYYSYDSQSLNTYNYDFPTDQFEYNNMELGLALKDGTATMSSERTMNKLISFFGRVNYSYDEKYIAALSIRGDGSSKFGPNNRWGAFWSASGAWRISQEGFMEDADWLDELKLKFSYGVTGVEPSSPYLSQMTYNYSNPVSMDGKYIWTISPAAVANPDLKWEEKHEYNIGLDFSMFKSRFSGSLDFYLRDTHDLLYSYSVPMPPNLASTIYANVGSISNRGVELTLSGDVVQTRDFNLTISGNVSYNENKILSLSNEHYQRDYMEVGSTGAPVQKTTHLVKEGGAVGDFYGWKSTGIKKNGAWICEGGTYGTEKARQIIGNGIPKINAGLAVQMAYKGFDLAFSLRGAFLYQILNQYRMLRETWQKGQAYNYPKTILEKPYGGQYGISASTSPSYVSYYVEDGDFVKLDNVTFGYNFKFKPDCPVKTLRLYLSGLNLFTFTGYKGIDPEVNFGGLSPGIDYETTYPTTSTVSFGVKLGF